MATFTTNYDLIKPGTEDYYDIADFNENMDAIDGQLSLTEQEMNKVKQELEEIKTGMGQSDALSAIDKKIGNSSDQTNATLFGAIATHKKATDATSAKVGNSSDQTNVTLFGAIATHKKVIDEINTKLGPLYTDATMVSTGNKITDFLRAIALTQGAVSDAGYTTVFGCLRNLCKHFGLIERYNMESANFGIKTNTIADYHNITIPKTKGNCFKIHTFQPEYNTNIRIKANMTGKAENMCFYVMDIVPANLMDIANTSVIPFDFQKTFSVYNQPLYNNAQHTQTAAIDIILPVVQGRIYHFLTSGALYDDNTLSAFEMHSI